MADKDSAFTADSDAMAEASGLAWCLAISESRRRVAGATEAWNLHFTRAYRYISNALSESKSGDEGSYSGIIEYKQLLLGTQVIRTNSHMRSQRARMSSHTSLRSSSAYAWKSASWLWTSCGLELATSSFRDISAIDSGGIAELVLGENRLENEKWRHLGRMRETGRGCRVRHCAGVRNVL